MTFGPDKPSTFEIDDPIDGEVLFEIVAYGNFVKVSAIDPMTNTEVCIIGSPSMSPYTLKMHALRKLKRALAPETEDTVEEATRRPGLWA